MAERVSSDEMSGALARALMSGLQERVDRAVDIGVRYGQIDGEHHKTWVIDQMLRAGWPSGMSSSMSRGSKRGAELIGSTFQSTDTQTGCKRNV